MEDVGSHYFSRYCLGQWKILLIPWLLFPGSELLAKELPRSEAGVQWLAKEKVSYKTSPATTNRSFDQSVQRQWLHLKEPIAARFLGGIIVPELSASKMERQFEDEELPRFLHQSLVGSRVGVSYLPHANEGAPHYFLGAYRYGGVEPGSTSPPMAEYWLGCDLDEYPYHFKFFNSDYTESRVALRIRSFPHGMRYVPFFSHTVATIGGWRFKATFPEELSLQYSPNRIWGVQARLFYDWIQYPLERDLETGQPAGWYEGYMEYLRFGGRMRLFKPLYFTFGFGLARHIWDEFSLEGDKLASFRSGYGLTADLGLQTLTITP